MSSTKVICVYNDLGGFYDVYPKISKSLRNMRDKILGIKGVKWGWHVVLTFDENAFDRIIKKGGFSGAVLTRFLGRTKSIYKKSRKYFWKYEEGRKFGRSHYHLLFEFKKRFNAMYVLGKLYKEQWKGGGVDLKRLIRGQRKYYMNKNKTDTEILMGLLLRKKWENGIVYAKQIEGLGWSHRKNLIYYVNKDLLKPTGFRYRKADSDRWHFGTGYSFDAVTLFKEKRLVSVNECVHKMLTTKQVFMDYYDSFGRNGYKFFFRKIRKMKQGEFFKKIK